MIWRSGGLHSCKTVPNRNLRLSSISVCTTQSLRVILSYRRFGFRQII